MRKLIAALVLAGPLAATGADLPKDVAERIAYKNGEALFPPQR